MTYILITGDTGMLGRYLWQRLECSASEGADCRLHGLNRRVCDLSRDVPQFGDVSFDVVYHLAGSEEGGPGNESASLNDEGTRRLLRGLEGCPRAPRRLVYVSSHRVYAPDAGEAVTEGRALLPADAAGRSKVRGESAVKHWCAEHGVECIVVRPARMLGEGVHGELARLFDRVMATRYVHVRGNDAAISLITAYDMAEILARLGEVAMPEGVSYLELNASDGKAHRWIDLCEAMTENAGARKRMPTLPADWAKWGLRLLGWIPSVREMIGGETQKPVSATQILDTTRLHELLGGNDSTDRTPLILHDTLAVLSRRDPGYPYRE